MKDEAKNKIRKDLKEIWENVLKIKKIRPEFGIENQSIKKKLANFIQNRSSLKIDIDLDSEINKQVFYINLRNFLVMYYLAILVLSGRPL